MTLTYLVVPQALSDEAAAQLSVLFNDLAFYFDGHYFSQITHYYNERRENERPCRYRQLDLFEDHGHDIEF